MTTVPIKKPIYEYIEIKKLLERWELSPQELYKYGEQGDLKIVIPWRILREEQCNKACVHTEEWKPLSFMFSNLSAHYVSPCKRCHHSQDKSFCVFEYTATCNSSRIPTEEKHRYQIHVESGDFFVHQEEVKRFEDKFREGEENQMPPYLQPEKMYHSKVMMAMGDAWISIFEKKEILDAKSCKQSVSKYIKKHHSQLEEYTTMTPKDNPFSEPKVDHMSALLNTCISETDWNKFVRDNKKK